METQKYLGFFKSLLVGVGLVLMFFPYIGFCIHSSANSSKVGNSLKKHIMQSYYERYDYLLDSYFQDFIAREIPAGLCEVLPHDPSLVVRPSILGRNLIGNGSHRHLTSSIRVNIKSGSIFELSAHHCELIIIERLPSGAFADPFELQHLLQRGVYKDVAVFGDTNLELPSFLSNRSAVEIRMDIGCNLLPRHDEELNIKVEIPLHGRYPPLDDSGYWEVKFGLPDLFMRCGVDGKSRNQSCLYKMPEMNGSELAFGKVVWKMPSGMKVHAGYVSILTFVAALLSAISIAVTSIFYSAINSNGKLLKES